MTIGDDLLKDRYANAALTIPGLHGKRLQQVAEALMYTDFARLIEGKEKMHPEHLKQAAREINDMWDEQVDPRFR